MPTSEGQIHWFVAGTTVDTAKMIEQIEQRAKVGGETALFTAEELARWAELIKNQGFPHRVVLVAMVEADDSIPYKEGSHHAAPIVKELLRWMGK